MSKSFADERGLIEDILVGPIDCVTRIFTRKGYVRGNHVHEQTTQWTYVVSGVLLTANPTGLTRFTAGSLFMEPPGIPHAWQAEEDTTVLVLTRGPGAGAAHEQDTRRLDVPLLP